MGSQFLNPDLRISTMTQIGHLSSSIQLDFLYEYLPVKGCIRYLEYGDKPGKGTRAKPKKVSKKSVHPEKPTKRKKYFYNQVTIHLFHTKIINVKIFNNGSVQMTGLKDENQGYETIQRLLSEIGDIPETQRRQIFSENHHFPDFYKKSHKDEPNLSTLYSFAPEPKLVRTQMVMINSDFDIGYPIDREVLHRSIVDSGHYSSFEPVIYPGVNIKYYHNPRKQQTGVCNCECMCDGKGKHGCCKKITVAVFKSGKIIITGGQSIAQINTAYDFITDFIRTREDTIRFGAISA
jgi:hypothetical protein